MLIEINFIQQNNEKKTKPMSRYIQILAIPGSMCSATLGTSQDVPDVRSGMPLGKLLATIFTEIPRLEKNCATEKRTEGRTGLHNSQIQRHTGDFLKL